MADQPAASEPAEALARANEEIRKLREECEYWRSRVQPADPSPLAHVGLREFLNWFDHAPVGIFFGTFQPPEILMTNRALQTMLGYSGEELARLSIPEITYPPDMPLDETLFQALLLSKHGSYQIEKRYIRKDGSLVWARIWVMLLRDERGEPRFATSIVEDIDAFKRKSDEFARQNELYRAMLQAQSDLGEGFLVVDGDKTEFVNDAFCQFTGYTREELLALDSIWELGFPEERALLEPRRRDRLAGKAVPEHYETAIRRKDGQRLELEVAVKPIDFSDPPRIVVTARDITREKADRAALRDREEKLRAIVEHAREVIFIVDVEGRHLLVNPAAEERIGRPKEAIIGKRYEELFPPEIARALLEANREVLERGEGRRYDEHIALPDGSARDFETSKYPYFSEDGRVIGVIGVSRDVTERNRLLKTLQEQNERLQELDRLKSSFVDAVSHELRTPLTSMIGYSEFLEDEIAGTLTPEQRAFVEQIQAGGQRLQNLVDDLLDFSRLNAGAFRLSRLDTDLGAKVSETLNSFQPQAREKDLALLAQLPDEPVHAEVDPQRIGQVLINLIGNAIKFTSAGGMITVTLRSEGDKAYVEVKDTGLGIAPENMSHLFERFYQVDPSLTRQKGGAGLGLSISKALVEAHGGEIGVESQPGLGSTFWFRLPLKPKN